MQTRDYGRSSSSNTTGRMYGGGNGGGNGGGGVRKKYDDRMYNNNGSSGATTTSYTTSNERENLYKGFSLMAARETKPTTTPSSSAARTTPATARTATSTTARTTTHRDGRVTNEDKFERLVGHWSASMNYVWEEFCDRIEHQSNNENLRWFTRNVLRRISIEAPVTVGFVLACVALHLLNCTFLPGISRYLGIRTYFSLLSPVDYLRLFTHIFGHDGMAHLRSNMSYILLVGPSAEAMFGSKEILEVILIVAISSGCGNLVLGRGNQMGASGVVFALILLNSMVSAKSGKIPLSFVLTAIMYLGDEVWLLFFGKDQISHHAHFIGGVVGTVTGFLIHQSKELSQQQRRCNRNKISGRKNKST